MPARLSVQRTPSRLCVSYDLSSLRKVKVAVGERMAIGMKDELRVYVKGDAQPLHAGRFGYASINEPVIPFSNPDFLKSTSCLDSVQDGIPAPGKRYVIEVDISLFETDIPPQHMWMPEGSKRYRVLWDKKLKTKS